jgi:prolyl-tRNA editing enzyme YbaK/EbsC (Cys-tRNA(Pro) deacylase)
MHKPRTILFILKREAFAAATESIEAGGLSQRQGAGGEGTSMKTSEDLARFIEENGLDAQIIEKSATESTLDACEAVRSLGRDVTPEQFIKALIVKRSGEPTEYLVVMVRGVDRVDMKAVSRAAGAKVSTASPEEAAEVCSYRRGGTPPVGLDGIGRVFIERRLVEPPRTLYGGGGDPEHVIEIGSEAMLEHWRSRDGIEVAVGDFAQAPSASTAAR